MEDRDTQITSSGYATLCYVMLRNHHDKRGHFGGSKVHSMILENYFWITMYSDIRDFIRNCVLCQRCKSDTHPTSRKLGSVTVSGVREIVAVVGKLPTYTEGFAYVCTIIDIFFTLSSGLQDQERHD